MIVQPGLPDDPKYLRLRKALRAAAPELNPMEVLIRLWSHCQLNQRGEFWEGANPDYVEAVCRWEGAEGTLFQQLLEKGWVVAEDGGVRIHDWEENNSTLVSAWRNGPMGGRPKKNRAQKTPRKPDANRPDNRPDNQSATDRVSDREIEREREGGMDAPARDFQEVSWPSEAEVLQECALRAIPAELGTKFWIHYESKYPKWTINGDPIGDWRLKLRGWKNNEPEKNPRSKNTDALPGMALLREIAAELQWQADPEKIAALKKRRAELESK